MKEFFKPWRRKAGCVTLLLACVFLGTWVRSITMLDIVIIPCGEHATLTPFSESQLLAVQYHYSIAPRTRPLSFSWRSFVDRHKMAELFNDDRITWHWQFCGLRSAEYLSQRPNGKLVFWLVPYWSIVIPLTLLSAWLVLSKPRPVDISPETG